MEVLLVLRKILSMFLIIFIGAFAYKIKWFNQETEKHLTTLMINIACPCIVFYSMVTQDRTGVMVGKATHTLILMTAVLIGTSAISIFVVKLLRTPRIDRGIYRLMIPFTNCGFMGYPLAAAVFGEEGLFLAIIANMAFNVVIFSLGALLLIYDMEEKGSVKETIKKIFSIPLVSCTIGLFLFFLGIKFPPMVVDTLKYVGDMTAPLAMLVVGIQLCQSSVTRIIKNRRLLLMTVVRLVVVPGLLFLGLRWVPVDPLVFCVVVFAMCMPAAAYISVLAVRYNSNKLLAAEGIFLSTMFSLITIPIFGMILNWYLLSI